MSDADYNASLPDWPKPLEGHAFDPDSPSQDCQCGWKARCDRRELEPVQKEWLVHIECVRRRSSNRIDVQDAAAGER